MFSTYVDIGLGFPVSTNPTTCLCVYFSGFTWIVIVTKKKGGERHIRSDWFSAVYSSTTSKYSFFFSEKLDVALGVKNYQMGS